MTGERAATVKQILDQAPKRAEKRKGDEKIVRKIFDSIGGFFTEYGGNAGDGRGRLLSLGPFPYTEDNHPNTPLYDILFIPQFDEKSRGYSVSIEAYVEDGADLRRLFWIDGKRLEDPLGREITGISDLRRSGLLINKMIKSGHRHLSKRR